MSTPAAAPVHVVSVPAGHPYVARSIAAAGQVDDGVLVLPDVIPDDRPAGQWWPPLSLDPSVLGDWLDGQGHPSGPPVDVVHVHFGFEGIPLVDLDACIALLDDHRVPLVLTVHDLRNPHVADDTEYAPRLERLVGAADVLVTLTTAAADEVRERWGRECLVVPHPHVASLERIDEVAGPRPRGGRLRVGLALKSLRPNTLTAAQVSEVTDAVLASGAELHIGIHHEALEPGFVRYDAAMADLVDRLDGTDGVTVTRHQRLDDDAYLDDLADHDVVLLPYRFGTHSGVLEACRDMATVVVAPSVGCYASQAPCPTFDPGNIAGTLPAALDEAARMLDGHGADGWFVDRPGRAGQAQEARRAHRDAYRRAIASAQGPRSEGTPA